MSEHCAHFALISSMIFIMRMVMVSACKKSNYHPPEKWEIRLRSRFRAVGGVRGRGFTRNKQQATRERSAPPKKEV